MLKSARDTPNCEQSTHLSIGNSSVYKTLKNRQEGLREEIPKNLYPYESFF